MTNSTELKALSEKAIQGELRVPTTEEVDEHYDCLYNPDDCHQMTTRQALTINGADPVLHLHSFNWTDDEIDANAAFLCALWNGYRSGHLLPSDRVRELEEENARLKAALEPFSKVRTDGFTECSDIGPAPLKARDFTAARNALKGETDNG